MLFPDDVNGAGISFDFLSLDAFPEFLLEAILDDCFLNFDEGSFIIYQYTNE